MASKKKSYYGGFFWLSLVSFIVPVFVALFAFNALPGPYEKPEPNPDASGVDHALWDYLLKHYVENGLVDYAGMQRDYLFQTYVSQLNGAQPEKLETDAERLALLCNAYNAFVIAVVINHKIDVSVMEYQNDDVGFFDVKEYIFAGQTLSLNDIEHTLIRKNYAEPRIHMALVCAARSCPVIRGEAYNGARLEKQLEDQARLFATNPEHVSYDSAETALRLSSILDWYGGDFDVAGGYRTFLAERVTDPVLQEALLSEGVAVTFNEYDWALNRLGNVSARTGGGGGNFGSGSLPTE